MLAPVFVLRSLVAFAVLSLVIAQDTSLGEVKNAFDNAKVRVNPPLPYAPSLTSFILHRFRRMLILPSNRRHCLKSPSRRQLHPPCIYLQEDS